MKKKWQIIRLGELCEFQRGLTYTKNDEVEISNNIVLRATNIDLTSNLLNLTELKYINENVVVPNNKKLKKDSLMICTASGSKSHLGKVAYIDEDYNYAFGGFMGMITPKNNLNPKYLFHLMTSYTYKDFIAKLSNGTNINNLKFEDLKKFQVPYPSLSEQQRIVSFLDKAFEGIAIAKANAEKNLKNARELFESYLTSFFSQSGKGWIVTTIGQQTRFIDYRGKTPIKTENGIRLITAKNVKMGFIKKEPMEFIAIDSYEKWMTRGIPQVGDVLFTTEAPLGNVAQLESNEKVAFAQRIIILQTDILKLDNTFFKYLLLSKPVQKRIQDKGTGATVKGIKASLLKTIEISYPYSIIKQRQAVENFKSLSSETSHLETIYQRKLNALDELKKSLLHQAFTGNL